MNKSKITKQLDGAIDMIVNEHNYEGAKVALTKTATSIMKYVKISAGKDRRYYSAVANDIMESINLLNSFIGDKTNTKKEAELLKRFVDISKASKNDSSEVKTINQHVATKPEVAKNDIRIKKTTGATIVTKPSNNATGGDLAPQTLGDFIGQPQAVRAVAPSIRAANLKGSALPHVLMFGSHGLGKSTFSKIISNELGVDFVEINPNKITQESLVKVLKGLKNRDILFVDEVHVLQSNIATSILYSALQEGKFTYGIGKGDDYKQVTYKMPPFTFIGATTEYGKMEKPFLHRLTLQIRLEEYTDDIIASIITNAINKLGMCISLKSAILTARCSLNNPRTAIGYARRLSDKALVANEKLIKSRGIDFDDVKQLKGLEIEVDECLIQEFFDENNIDKNGLGEGERKLLELIITLKKGAPVGKETLVRTMNESENIVTDKYEANLLRARLITIEPTGRRATQKGFKYMGYPCQETDDTKSSAINNVPSKNVTKSEETVRYNIQAEIDLDDKKVDVINALITYPNGSTSFDDSICDIFEKSQKEFESTAVNKCEVLINFPNHSKVLECDSKLERRFIAYLASAGYITDIETQFYEIKYDSQLSSGKRYYPDFIIKDHLGRISIIEMKNQTSIGYHLNIDKYFRLKDFCVKNGYGYAQIMKVYSENKYINTEDILSLPIDIALEEHIYSTIKSREENGDKGYFYTADFDEYKNVNNDVKVEDLLAILLQNRNLKNTDKYGGFKIEIV